MKQAKIWGQTELVWSGVNVEIHRINIVNGGYCSKHKHEHKYNMFYVESGELQVIVYKDNNLEDITTITTGESTTVNPGEYHMFHANCDTVAYEIYWVELTSPDIIRETVGGVDGLGGAQ